MVLQKLKGGLMAFAQIHPSLIDWFEKRVADRPEIAPILAFAMVIMVWYLERPSGDENAAYKRYVATFQRVTDAGPGHEALPVLDEADFNGLMQSIANAPGISNVLGREPLIVEHGPIGRVRQDLWASGLREPEVSQTLMQIGLSPHRVN